MSFSVCIANTAVANFLQQWEYVLSHFQPQNIYVYETGGTPAPVSGILGKSTLITSVSDLPRNKSLVLLAPPNGLNIQGDTSLYRFKHPEECIYFFGSDSVHLDSDIFNDRVPDHKVFIPTDTKDQMYSFVSCAITLYDRKLKWHS